MVISAVEPRRTARQRFPSPISMACSTRCERPARVTSRSGWRRPAKGKIGEIARAFNDLQARNDQMSGELVRVGKIIGREGRMTERATLPRRRRRVGDEHRLDQLADRRPRPADDRGRARDRRRRRGRPLAEDGARDRGPAGQGRVPAHRHDRQHDGRPAVVVRRRGHARGARGRHRGQARRPGGGAGRRRHLEGPDRQRQLAWPRT